MKKIYTLKCCILFCILTASYSCQKKYPGGGITGPPPSADTVIRDTSIFIDITLDGKRTLGLQVKQVDTLYGPWGQIFYGTAFLDSLLYPKNTQGIIFGKNSGLIFHFAKTGATLYPGVSYRIVDSFFTPGTYAYAKPVKDTTYPAAGSSSFFLTQKLLTNGMYIAWRDFNGMLWQTAAGDQAGSSFTITDHQTSGNPLADAAAATVVTAVFNCKLYDKTGKFKLLTNGRFRLIVWF